MMLRYILANLVLFFAATIMTFAIWDTLDEWVASTEVSHWFVHTLLFAIGILVFVIVQGLHTRFNPAEKSVPVAVAKEARDMEKKIRKHVPVWPTSHVPIA